MEYPTSRGRVGHEPILEFEYPLMLYRKIVSEKGKLWRERRKGRSN